MKKLILPFSAAIFWFLLSVFLLTIPGSELPKEDWLDKIWFDKWVHIGMFGILAVLWCWAFYKKLSGQGSLKTIFIWIGIACLLYGTGMEFVQKYWIPNRSFDVGDIAADGIGSALGTWFSWRRYIKK